jgi:hypothetical protein
MSKSLQIKSAGTNTLSKEQKRYNSLLKNIKELQESIQELKEDDQFLREQGVKVLLPLEQRMEEAKFNFLNVAVDSPFSQKLPKKLKKREAFIFAELSAELLNTNFYHNNEQLKQIFDAFNEKNATWDDHMAESEAQAKAMTAQIFKNQFGVDLTEDDMESPEAFFEKMKTVEEVFKAQQEKQEEKRQKRKKTPKQEAAAEKKRLAEAAIQKSAKQIYVELVKNFHPDQEQDEQRKIEKTEIMKQVTAAYNENNHLKLLELQMTLLQGENVFERFDDTQLRYFNDALNQQMYDLQAEAERAHPGLNDNPFGGFYAPTRKGMEQKIKAEAKEYQYVADAWLHNLEVIKQDLAGYKEFIEVYQIEEAPDMDDMASILADLMNEMEGGGRKRRR